MTSSPGSAAQAFRSVSGSRHVLTIGNFDGVHRGHQHLLRKLQQRATELNAPTLVVTFEPHPIAVLRPEHAPSRIATPDFKLELLELAGIDEVAVLPFDREFASLSPEEFLALLTGAARPVEILVGQGFRFGKMRAGDIETMREFGRNHDFDAREVPPLTDELGVVSSSRVRSALQEGNVEHAAELLGRRFRLVGEVEHGAARGRDLGFPTANLSIAPRLCIPADGIYAGYAHLDNRNSGPREALIYIGTSPTFGDRERLVEVNILDYRGNLYSRQLEIEFLAFIRPDRAFDSADELMNQMAADEAASRAILARSTPEQAMKGD